MEIVQLTSACLEIKTFFECETRSFGGVGVDQSLLIERGRRLTRFFLVVKERTPDIATTCVPTFFATDRYFPSSYCTVNTGRKQKEGDALTHPNHNISAFPC